MKFRIKSQLSDEKAMNRTITRLAHEIVENNKGIEDLCLVGIRTRGEFLARRIVKKIAEFEKEELPLGILDIVMYRDDYRTKNRLPAVEITDIPFNIDNKKLVLIDDVIYTGRTIRAALDALIDLGRPSGIQLAVMVDRGHREMPIRPDYVGKNCPTAANEEISVKVKECDGVDVIDLMEEDK